MNNDRFYYVIKDQSWNAVQKRLTKIDSKVNIWQNQNIEEKQFRKEAVDYCLGQAPTLLFTHLLTKPQDPSLLTYSSMYIGEIKCKLSGHFAEHLVQ